MTDTSAPSGPAGRTAAWLRLVALVVVVGLALGLLAAFSDQVGETFEVVRSVIDRAGVWGPVLFVLAYAVLTVLLVPGSPLTVAAGVLFGPFLGTALVVVGATLGASGAFLWGRRLGRDAVVRLAGDRFTRLEGWLADRGFLAVLYARLVAVPFNVSNPVAGVVGVPFRAFVAGTFVGIVPGTFAFAALGGSLDDLTSPVFLSAVALTAVLAVGAPLVDRRVRAARAG